MERDHPSDPALAARGRPSPRTSLGGNRWQWQHRPHPLRLLHRRRQTAALAGLLASAALVSAACSGNHRPASPATSGGNSIARGTASWYGPKFDGHRTASGERYNMRSLTAAHPRLPFGTLVQVTNLDNGRQVVVRINDRGPFGRRRVIDLSYAAARQLAMVGRGTADVDLAILAPGGPGGPGGPPEPVALLAQPVLLAAGEPANPLASPGPPSPPGPQTSLPGAPDADAGAAADSDSSGSAQPPQPLQSPSAGPAPAAGAGGALRTQPAALHYTVQVGAFDEVERAGALQQNLARLYPETAVHSDGIWNRVQVGLFGDREQAELLRRELAALGLEALVVAAH
jgi:rare lipoprotein A